MLSLASGSRRDLALCLLALVAGATLIVRLDIAARRAAFHAEARTLHCVLSQATARLDAVLATLVLMAPPAAIANAAADDAAARLFEPFVSTRPGGLGLGLPLAQTLALAQDRHVQLRAGGGPGAAFVLELPVVEAAPVEAAA